MKTSVGIVAALVLVATLSAQRAAPVLETNDRPADVPRPQFSGLQALPKVVEAAIYSTENRSGAWRETLPADIPVGEYRIEATLTIDAPDAATGRGYRVCMAAGSWPSPYFCTAIRSASGTYELTARGQIAPKAPMIEVQAYNKPTGSIVASVRLIQVGLVSTQSMFLKYPNYRGVLEGNEAVVNLAEEATVELIAADGTVLDSVTGAGDLTLDASGVRSWATVRAPGHADYVIERGKAPIDRDNRFLKDGEPYIPIGVYDSGLPYIGETDPRWPTMLDDRRKLSELKPDIYLNYHYGRAPANALRGLANAVAPGKYVQPANCFAAGCGNYRLEDQLRISKAEFNDVASKKWWGVYLADEAVLSGVRSTWEASTWLRRWPGFTLGVLNRPREFSAWRDNLDVLGVDPYPLIKPDEVQDLSEVPRMVAQAREAVQDSRPIMAVLQFFQFRSTSRWPTQKELESMGLMAIAEGADGVLFWSIGNGRGALWYGSTCAADSVTWCPERVEYHNRLKGAFELLRQVDPSPNVTVSDTAEAKVVRKGSSLIAYNKTPNQITVLGQRLGPYEAVLIHE